MSTWNEATTGLLLQSYTRLLRPLLYRIDAETIHKATIDVLGHLPGPALAAVRAVVGAARQPVTVAGIEFPGRVGLAAGQDKDGVAARAWASMGFGFAELGTVTAQAQPGNPAPRLFRAPELDAFVNRMGFNNAGAAALADRLQKMGVERGNGRLGLPIGVSIGKTKVVPLDGAVDDYLTSFDAVAPVADYIAVNVSSPNTPGLRTLQATDELARLAEALTARAVQQAANPVPIFVKVAPDLDDDALLDVVRVCESTGVSGLIAVNTTISRPSMTDLAPKTVLVLAESGGLSGGPLTARALEVVRGLHGVTSLPLIASGGVMTPADAQNLFDAGAVLVQVLSGFIYSGPALTRGINRLTLADRRHHA